MKKLLVPIALFLATLSLAQAAGPTAGEQEKANLSARRDALQAANTSATTALQAMNGAMSALSGVPVSLPSSRTSREAQQMISFGMPADDFLAAIDRLAAQPEDVLKPLDRAGLGKCRAAAAQLKETAALDDKAIDSRATARNAEAFQAIEESQDLQFRSLARAMMVSGWLAAEVESLQSCLPPLQRQLSEFIAGSNRELLRIDDRLLLQSLEAATEPPPEPKTPQ